MQLVVQADLLIRHILAARELHAIHAQIRVRQTRVTNVLGIHLGQGDEGSAVVRPGLELRQLVDRQLVGQHRSPRRRRGRMCNAVGRARRDLERCLAQPAGVGLERDQVADVRRACRGR